MAKNIFGEEEVAMPEPSTARAAYKNPMLAMAEYALKNSSKSTLPSKLIEAKNREAFDNEIVEKTNNWGAHEQKMVDNYEKTAGRK